MRLPFRYLLLIASDNAAARALARVSPLGYDGFIARMNEKAAELGLETTHYADPSGLLSENVSSAYGYYLDDSMPGGFGGIMATKGFKMTPFAGYYVGRDRVLKARVSGDVTYRKLEMHLGAVVQGRLCHNEPGVAAVVELKRAPAESGATGATR